MNYGFLVASKMDFGGQRRITNLAAGAANGEPVVFEQLNAAIEGVAWKDSCRVASQVNVTLTSPGATIDGISMVSGDRVLIRAQTTQSENGIYIWNGAATPMTRSLDASTSDELEQAITTVEEGTSAAVSYRQSQVNFTLGSGNIIWVTFGQSSSVASETVAGVAEIATQAETDAGTDDARIVTSLKLATYANRKLKFSANVGDGSATSIAVTHNLNTRDVTVQVWETSGSFREIFVEKQLTSVNQVTLVFDTAPTANQYRVVVLG